MAFDKYVLGVLSCYLTQALWGLWPCQFCSKMPFVSAYQDRSVPICMPSTGPGVSYGFYRSCAAWRCGCSISEHTGQLCILGHSSLVRSSVLRVVVLGEILPWGCPIFHLCWKSHWSFRWGSVRAAYTQLFYRIINILLCLLFDIPRCKPWCAGQPPWSCSCAALTFPCSISAWCFSWGQLWLGQGHLCAKGDVFLFSLQIMPLFQMHLSPLTYSWQKQGFKYFIAFFLLFFYCQMPWIHCQITIWAGVFRIDFLSSLIGAV